MVEGAHALHSVAALETKASRISTPLDTSSTTLGMEIRSSAGFVLEDCHKQQGTAPFMLSPWIPVH